MAIADSAEDDGTNAWPSVRHLAAKTMLSEATVHRCIRALEAKGLIAVERNAGGRRDTAGNRRPNRYAVLMGGPSKIAHRVVDNPSDSPDSGVSNCDPNPSQGCQSDASGVSKPAARGVTGDTQSTLSHPETSTSTRASAPASATTAGDENGGGGEPTTQPSAPAPAPTQPAADLVLARLGADWPLGPAQRGRIARGIAAALSAGWPPDALAELLAANRDGVRSPYAVLRARLDDLPSHPRRPQPRPVPPWCGHCGEHDRWEETEHGLRRCPRCHPQTQSDAAPAA
jgi:Helix-turn-helix domain